LTSDLASLVARRGIVIGPGGYSRNPGCRTGLPPVSRWYDPDSHRGEFYRPVAIAADAPQRKGVPAASLKDHVIALNVGNIVTVITRPDAFTAAEWQGARARLQAQGFNIPLAPDSRSTPPPRP
jgi:hypothetical protein